MRKIWTLIACLAVFFMFSCKTEEMLMPEESIKDLSGSWHIVKAVQNNKDLTSVYDFSKFRINFLENQRYELENLVPFIVSKGGNYALDDGQFAFQIDFNAEGLEGPVHSTFDYPIVDGVRNLRLTFSPGCTNNTYIYTLKKINP